MRTIIDQQYEDGKLLVDYLKNEKQLSLFNEAENNFKKTLLLSAASFFEKDVSETIIKFVESHTNKNELIISIIRQKVIERQYHSFFDWDKSNANKFFSLFGEDFKKYMGLKVKDDLKLDHSIKSFIEIGQERNKMVHQNFAEIVIDKTAEEIHKLYQDSLYFIEIIKLELIKQSP